MLDQSTVRRLFDYDPITGLLTWRERANPKSNVRVGSVVGYKTIDGYLGVNINKKTYKVHRIIWLHVYGHLPKRVDHRDNNGFNNRLKNLRNATVSQNAQNATAHKDNACRRKGVYQRGDTGRWTAQICINGKKRSLGCFPTAEAASKAYARAAVDLHGEFARTA